MTSAGQTSTGDFPALTRDFLSRADGLFAAALDALTDVYIFVKDRSRRFVYCNAAFVRLMGFQQVPDLIGLSDPDLSPAYLAKHYRQDDSAVLEGRIITDRVELVRNLDGNYDWFTTTKLPVRECGSAAIIGLLGITRHLTKRDAVATEVFPLERAIKVMSERYAERLTVRDLAAHAGMSSRTFSETFRRHFGTTPNRYLRNIRLLAASELLVATELSIAVIASKVGYYDQSHLTHDFHRFFAMPPREYRTKYRDVARLPAAAAPPWGSSGKGLKRAR